MKHLPKHIRPRWRYLAVELETWPDADLSRGSFQRELWFAAQNFVGDAGSADADLTVLDFHFSGCVGETVVRARRGYVSEARAALACIDEISGHSVGIRVRGVSGTVRACEERYLRRPAGVPEERSVVFADSDRTALARDTVLDVRLSSGFVGATELDFE
ncbi:ribonuclease P/MRP protein subunit POP5 [Halogranum rubrum]|uniref:Ribonuclease P protein component 2 n=2 Tax=Halogranum rubrum TaxID=553466 RepID=A0A1I4EQ15_9EURY|nr:MULTISPECIES: Rpp14/Pop5 family protein [Halogranum]EJN60334.1 ribonuclease p protein subunit rpp14 [Halogranum salarium B-1]SFL07303.1 ribonuclease P/MRP protein subunit POP5 [Halogranum rubrum]